MQRHHTGSGRRTVIPHDWSAHHRDLLAGTRGATITLRRPGAVKGPFNPATGKYPMTPNAPYYGLGATEPNARIQVLPGADQERVAGEQEITTLGYAVMLDHAVSGMQLGDVVTVTAMSDNGDPWMVARQLTVDSIESGSLHWERRLLCTDNLETQEA